MSMVDPYDYADSMKTAAATQGRIDRKLNKARQAADKAGTTAKNVFAKANKSLRNMYHRSTARDPLVGLAKGMSRMFGGATAAPEYLRKTTGVGRAVSKFVDPRRSVVAKGTARLAKGILGHRLTWAGMLVAGASAMLAVGVMRGVTNQGREIVFDRYMQDQRYARNILMNSRVGLASGTNRMHRYGATEGLSNSLHRARHGRGAY